MHMQRDLARCVCNRSSNLVLRPALNSENPYLRGHGFLRSRKRRKFCHQAAERTEHSRTRGLLQVAAWLPQSRSRAPDLQTINRHYSNISTRLPSTTSLRPPSTTTTLFTPVLPKQNRRFMLTRIQRQVQRQRTQDSPAHRTFDGEQDDQPISMKYLRKLHLPTAEDYPAYSPRLFNDKDVAGELHNLCHRSKVAYDSSTVGTSSGASFSCRVVIGLPKGGQLEAVGEGTNKRDARNASHLHVLLKLHESDQLRTFTPPNQTLPNVSKDEEDLVGLYNYAAQRSHIPIVAIERTGNGGSKRAAVSIKLPGLGVVAKSAGKSLQSAIVQAAASMKRKIESIHASGTSPTEDRMQDLTGISTTNAKQFLDYVKQHGRRFTLSSRVEDTTGVHRDGGYSFEGNAVIDGSPLDQKVHAFSQKTAELLTDVVAAVALIRRDKNLLAIWRSAAKSLQGEVLLPLSPIYTGLDRATVSSMDTTLRELGMCENLAAGLDTDNSEVSVETTRKIRDRRRLSPEELRSRSAFHKRRLEAFASKPDGVKMLEAREALPMNEWKDDVLEHIENNAYSIIIGATGSGKTTQVPQIVLDDAIMQDRGAECDIICTQPRRIAATSVAQRVSQERLERMQASVGYQVRFDARLPEPGGSITYCTTGVLLQQIQRAPDEVFDTVSHIIIDEVHERDILIDFLLNVVRRTARRRRASGARVPKIILMSATIDPQLFASYFEQYAPDGRLLECPSISVPGRTFPVEEKYYRTIIDEMEQAHGRSVLARVQEEKESREFMALEDRDDHALVADGVARAPKPTIDWRQQAMVRDDEMDEIEEAIVPFKLVATVIAHIAKTTSDGAILVFLPGYEEIKKVRDILEKESPLRIDVMDSDRYRISTLHSSVPAAEQAMVFQAVPEGCRKIILSTNIAETSVTIPDVQYVVDSGKLRQKRYDQVRRITKLQCTWVSKSNAKQRMGRAGRVQNGNYYALYTKARAESLRAVGLPEMLRSDLQEICLDIKAQNYDVPIADFLASSIEPPTQEAVQVAIEALKALQALTDTEHLTALGRVLSNLPVHPSLGKMIILGVIFRCLDPMIILGAGLNERSPFLSPPGMRREAEEAHRPFVEDTKSDHIALINAIRHTRLIEATRGAGAARDFCVRKFVHYGAYKTIVSTSNQIEDVLVEAGLIPRTPPGERYAAEVGSPELNKTVLNSNVIIALTVAGLNPNIGVFQDSRLRTLTESKTTAHPGSINFVKGGKTTWPPRGTLLTYSAMSRSNDGKQLFLRGTSVCLPLMAMLFCGRYTTQERTIVVGDWLPFSIRTDHRSAETLLDFRDALDFTLNRAFELLARLKSKRLAAAAAGKPHDEYLADDPVISTFAKGLVDVLDRSAENEKRTLEMKEEKRGAAHATLRDLEPNGYQVRSAS